MKPELRSWMTTACGIGAVMCAIGSVMVAAFDQDPNTIADLQGVVTTLQTLAAILFGGGLVAARDSRRSSQDVGVRPRRP